MNDPVRALDFLRGIDRRASSRVEQLAFGCAYLRPELPRVWSRNFVLVSAVCEEDQLPAVLAESEAVHRRAGLSHCRIVFADEVTGERAGALFGPQGWRCDAERIMIDRAATRKPARDPRVQVVDGDALREASAAMYLDHPDVRDAETVEQLFQATRCVAAATTERCFAWMEDGEVAGFCRLFSNGSTAQIEDVGTVPRFRGRGIATAVVSTALSVARGEHEMTFLLADDSDWPKRWYERLGFEGTGLLRELVRT